VYRYLLYESMLFVVVLCLVGICVYLYGFDLIYEQAYGVYNE
jgi:hypothetical protein